MDDRHDPADRLAGRLTALTSGRVLDVGCGEGRFLPESGIGIDLDAARLRTARERSAAVACASALALPFAQATFDTVHAHRMLNDTGDVDRALREIVRVLRRSGTLLVFTRARQAEGDRLDRWNGAERLRAHFAEVTAEVDAYDERAALFIARRPL